MTQIVGFLNNKQHHETCQKCGAIVGFDNEDIIRDEMGCEIICPNCGTSIKF